MVYFATEIWAFVIPAVIGTCAVSTGLDAIVTAPPIPTSWFAEWAFHSASSRTKVRRPEASTMVALLEAKFWT